ncbi:ATP-binding protein [Dyadobacter chenwenxiniae]|uniref:ATP-binding protein n=1 Tax=Dyadobacter chenwenxiniae TaxID=2906456 RepID=A0A9X1TG81_9BACT|nr:ATP-binding protein [Dyadobacter chenwenxiniae]MCF0051898.1 ATP-binding protein [Dyadobacter chenwenxiniae]MCF0063429.1 ATP-binding protein [Dyadobacter chenwenxiniae]UON85192.1 ATP-binding protein [Dyadobacter chenwenxiniae]
MESKSFPGTVDSLDSLREYIGELSEKAGLAKKPTYSLKLAVDEIATNIILYGYQAPGIEADFQVVSEITAEKLVVILEDIAAPFDPLAKELPNAQDLTLSLEERGIGGLGIFLTINGVDEFSYEYAHGKNRNKFVMKIAAT